MILSRVALIPVIAAVGYEILRFGAKHRGNALIRALYLPGIWVQMITTKQPTDDQIEVAIVSMERALEADGEEIPVGSADLASEPLDKVTEPNPAGALGPNAAATGPTSPGSVQVQPPAAES
jgi:hypothetical protein